jgi:allophanate hydrolase
VSIFALTVDDAMTALDVLAAPDAGDPFSRTRPLRPAGPMPVGLKFGIPRAEQRLFFDDKISAAAYDAALLRFADLGVDIVEVDFAPFYAAARLLYEGPWVAERYLTVKDLLARSPDSLLPVTRQIIAAGAKVTAAEAFAAFYKLEEFRRNRDETFRAVDALVLPTAPTIYSVNDVAADPITLNSRLGTYTNFVNLLDLCGLALPSSIGAHGRPFGVTLLAPGGEDGLLASVGRQFHFATGLPLGALKAPQPPLARPSAIASAGEVAIAVVGAHLSGMQLNGELRRAGGRLLENTMTAPHYRLFDLTAANPPKPGLLRVKDGEGAAIEIEIWALPEIEFGRFVAEVQRPMSIGTLGLADGRVVKGFLVEAEAVKGARDISSFGGWRAFTSRQRAAV